MQPIGWLHMAEALLAQLLFLLCHIRSKNPRASLLILRSVHDRAPPCVTTPTGRTAMPITCTTAYWGPVLPHKSQWLQSLRFPLFCHSPSWNSLLTLQGPDGLQILLLKTYQLFLGLTILFKIFISPQPAYQLSIVCCSFVHSIYPSESELNVLYTPSTCCHYFSRAINTKKIFNKELLKAS